MATITNSEIAEGGIAGSFLSGFKVSKTRYAHPVSCALEILLKMPYNEEAPTNRSKNGKETKNKNSQFKFWSLTHDMEMFLLHSVTSLRSKNFKFFFESLEEMLPFFWARSFELC